MCCSSKIIASLMAQVLALVVMENSLATHEKSMISEDRSLATQDKSVATEDCSLAIQEKSLPNEEKKLRLQVIFLANEACTLATQVIFLSCWRARLAGTTSRCDLHVFAQRLDLARDSLQTAQQEEWIDV